MSRTSREATTDFNPHGKPVVVGLEAGRSRLRSAGRRRRRRDRIVTGVLASVAAAIVTVVGWGGYRFYQENQQQNRLETEQRRAELEQPGDIDEIIVDLVEQPRWNGPGNPTFGVGEEETVPEIVVIEP